jgi:hypothetical protein
MTSLLIALRLRRLPRARVALLWLSAHLAQVDHARAVGLVRASL